MNKVLRIQLLHSVLHIILHHNGEVGREFRGLVAKGSHKPLLRIHKGKLNLIEQDRTKRLEGVQISNHGLWVNLCKRNQDKGTHTG